MDELTEDDRRRPGPWDRPRGNMIMALVSLMIAAFTAQLLLQPIEPWALSPQALREGRYETLFTHMFTHAGLAHLAGNAFAMIGLSPAVASRMGWGPASWGRFLLLFFLGGLCGAGLFLALNPASEIPMVGASGAICALWGAASRISPERWRPLPVLSRQSVLNMGNFALMNLVLFLLIGGLARLAGAAGGLAWEAHLGGYLFGLLAIPAFAGRTAR